MRKMIILVLFLFLITGCGDKVLKCRYIWDGYDYTKRHTFVYDSKGTKLKTYSFRQYHDRNYTDDELDRICAPYEEKEGVTCKATRNNQTMLYYTELTYDFEILGDDVKKSMDLDYPYDEAQRIWENKGYKCDEK